MSDSTFTLPLTAEKAFVWIILNLPFPLAMLDSKIVLYNNQTYPILSLT